MAREEIKLFYSLNDILRMITAEILGDFSYESRFGISLKKTLRHFNESALLAEAESVAEWLLARKHILPLNVIYRIKTRDSIRNKYERMKSVHGVQVREIFNDILGLRFICADYDNFLCANDALFRVVDMSGGKKNDDGYRGVHIYYQKNNLNYPVEIQLHTLKDSRLNAFLHDHVYKKKLPCDIGRHIREKYEENLLKGEDGLKNIDSILPENNMHTLGKKL